MKPRIIAALALIIVILTQLSCNFVSQLGESTGSTGGDSIYTTPGNPINVTITLDSASITSQIPTSGGELQVTGTDGTRYTLTIPPDALTASTEITMTAVASINGLPFSGGLGGAVKLEPDGLAFFDFVTLTIEPANPIPPEKQILFGFEANGEDLHLAIPGSDPNAIQIRLLHFSGAGVADGISAEKAGVLQRMADRAELRLTSQVAEYLQNLDRDQDPDPAVLENALQEYYNSVIAPRLKAAASASATCADGKKAFNTFLGWDRQRQLLGMTNIGGNAEGLANDLLPILAKKCFDEEFDRCANKHQIAGLIPTLLGFERTGQLLGAFDTNDPSRDEKSWVDVRAYGETLAQKCFQWDLEFSSAGSFSGGLDFDASVKAKVPIRMNGPLIALKFDGSSALISTDFTFRVPGCSVTSNRGGGQFTVESLAWESELRKDTNGEERFFVKDYLIAYDPGRTSENFTVTCPDPTTTLTTPAAPYWTALFIVTHYKEVEGGNGTTPASIDELLEGSVALDNFAQSYVARSWQVNEAEVLAQKQWQGNSDLDSSVFEGGAFRLIHRPQK